ncbi:MAG: thiamine diphosphokinase [Balneolaceae bacterium]
MKIGKKYGVILCNGRPPGKEQIEQALVSSDLFIAADGGGNHARILGLVPDIVIGDLDSYLHLDTDDYPIIEKSDQNSNDLEKALIYAVEQQITDITVFGATGFRLDHTLKNLSVMKQFNYLFNQLVFLDTYCKTMLIEPAFRQSFPRHTTLSLFPLSGSVSGINSKGLKYELNNDTLKNGEFDGSSNETVAPEIEITYEKGDLLLIINHNEETTA